MVYEEFKRQVGKAGLTFREFADLLKLNPTSISNRAKRGGVPNHLAVIAALMGEMKDHQIDFKSVLARIEIVPNKPRGAGKGTFGGKKQDESYDLFKREKNS
jgi:hypothetical protein